MLALAALFLLPAGCGDDLCKGEDPAFEVSVLLDKGVSEKAITMLKARVLAIGMDNTFEFPIKDELADRRTTFFIVVGKSYDVSEEDFTAQVRLTVLDKNKAVVAKATVSLENSGDACNFHQVTLGATSGVVTRQADVEDRLPGGELGGRKMK